eukprot:6572563-Karenia_brevis.AAC.1
MKVPCCPLGHTTHRSVVKRTVAAFNGMMQDLLDAVACEAADVERLEARTQPSWHFMHQKDDALAHQRRALPDVGFRVHNLR